MSEHLNKSVTSISSRLQSHKYHIIGGVFSDCMSFWRPKNDTKEDGKPMKKDGKPMVRNLLRDQNSHPVRACS